jgi:hypothetical protein
MSYTLEEYKIESRLEKLDLSLPKNLSFFPENIDIANSKNEFIFTESVIDLNKYFIQNNIIFDFLGGDKELYRSRKNADIYLPAIFFSLSTISENPEIVSVSLNILSSYIYDRLKGIIGEKNVKIEFHIETKEKGKIIKIDYKGDAEGIKNLENIIKTLR